MRFLSCGILSLICFSTSTYATPFSHQQFDQVLQQHVDSRGRVSYALLKENRSALDTYIDSLAAISPHNHPDRFPSRQHQLAYWINAYNAFVLRGVIDAYPVSSVMDIMRFNGFFRRRKFTAGGEELTLDSIENKIIRPTFEDPRIHFTVNCGAVSCPELENRAFTGEDLDRRLEAALRRFARNPKHVFLDSTAGKLYLSKILEWYGGDFITWFPQERKPAARDPKLVDYLLPYLPAAAATYLERQPGIDLTFRDYDWALNEQKP
ncbi:MAG: DUF547 domain-containing protein [Gemmatimonadetes bacterium]|jgi:hypothetical protein|nr:DUF547 domain-containing protein [Gemmatimonadota bacterium]